MLFLNARIVTPHILRNEELIVRIRRRARELLGSDGQSDAYDFHLVILLHRLPNRCRRLAYKIVRGRHQFQVEIDFWRNQAINVEHVRLRATEDLDHGACRECLGASVETGIVPAD